jgi:hypothetical protein
MGINNLKNSAKIWEGESPFDNQDIFAVVTGINGLNMNRKIGRMAQVWILSKKDSPYILTKTGDFSVCGTCLLSPHLKNKDKCYVARLSWQAPSNVWKTHVAANQDVQYVLNQFKEYPTKIRFGAYGDPAMLPESLFETLLNPIKSLKRTHTAYTHQHQCEFSKWLKKYAMASCQSYDDALNLWDDGWRTFRITQKQEALKNEIVCPNVTKKISCSDCCLCDGKHKNDKRLNITIPRH